MMWQCGVVGRTECGASEYELVCKGNFEKLVRNLLLVLASFHRRSLLCSFAKPWDKCEIYFIPRQDVLRSLHSFVVYAVFTLSRFLLSNDIITINGTPSVPPESSS